MSDYIAIPLRVGPKTTQEIYVRRQIHAAAKKHNSKASSSSDSDSDSDSDDDEDRTLFVTNLPLDTTEDNIRDICKALGDVVLDRYVYQGGRHGLICLVDEAAASRFLAKAKKLSSKNKAEIVFQQYGPRGVEGYMAHYRAMFPEENELQEKVDEYMELFAQKEEEERREAEEAAETVDADGFRTVVYRNRKRMADMTGPMTEDMLPTRKRKKSLEKSDFYRFQLREKHKQEMSDLLKRYQEDKAKVEEMKERKKFRPY